MRRVLPTGLALLIAGGALAAPTLSTTRMLPGPTTLPPADSADPKADVAYGAYQRGYYIAAFREATKRLEKDRTDAAAMTLLGELYSQGLGLRQDPAKAAEWYRLAANLGDRSAMGLLGMMAIEGRGIAKDPAAGRAWLEKAAAKGEPTACYNVALILLGTGVPEDLNRAAALLRQAADQEVPAAQHALGILYLKGRGVEKDPAQAAQLFRRAADNGDVAGEVEFSILLFNGEGVPKDEARAARYFRHAAGRGNAVAQNRIARLYAAGRGVPKNLVEAAAWNMAASAQGLTDAWLTQALAGLNPEERARAERLAADRMTP
ncbi:tetratricopeptide repeat protein [Methylobacterium nodulans]|uniref:Sel1 domain protein repeat-containing protein n=1 Tax=Methylobacterium nodulans (strain LMG 21967 / CNCM I-2342 / ORS 2060) TaxID=460265 RepID=B8ILP5_METNO|nr:tetratricopeptide repeat protein [Methylobacterium nodulans]ACL62020.1 Sel1 domain protein repeat-containing protein [Methylobacterium nodulans ORS 2060]